MRENILSYSWPYPNESMRVHLAGESFCDGSYRMARQQSNTTVFEYIVSGRGILIVDDEQYQPETGDVYIVPYGSNHEYRSSASEPWHKLWFNVVGPLTLHLLEGYGLTGVHLLRQCPVRSLFEDGLRNFRENPERVHEIAPGVIANLIAALGRFHSSAELPVIPPEAAALRQFLESAIFQPSPSLEEMAAKVHKSPVHTIRMFRQFFGTTPYAYLLKRKIETAELLLKNTAKPVKVIAFELGFCDEYYFSNIFRKKTGFFPLHYRRQ